MAYNLVWTVTFHITRAFTGGAVHLLQLPEPPADLDLFSLTPFKLPLVPEPPFFSRSPTAPNSVSDITQTRDSSINAALRMPSVTKIC